MPALSSAARIVCPACKSEISGDGSTLHAMSKRLEELIETDADVEKVEKALAQMEAKYKAVGQENEKLRAELLEAKTKPEAPKNENVGTEQTAPKRGSWW